MGQTAAREFPSFYQMLQRLDSVLAQLNPPPSFTVKEFIINHADATAINKPEISQLLCTAIQIALVDLFDEWNINPSVNAGHSSSEIGAAYAAGLISAPEAILAAYCRGHAVKAHSSKGSMLAVGLGADEAEKYMLSYTPDQLCIACENSPSSVTLSGLPEPISEIKKLFDGAGIFARELKTSRAYHSPHMASVGSVYEQLLANALHLLDKDDLLGSKISGLSSGARVWRNVLRDRDIPWLKDHTVSFIL